MKRNWMIVSAGIVLGLALAQVPFHATAASDSPPATMPAAKALVPSTQTEKESYAMGVQMGRNFKRMGVEFSPAFLAQGVNDAMTTGNTALREEELMAAMSSLVTKQRANQNRLRMINAEENKKVGEQFLATNKTKEGVVTLPSGLQYRVLKGTEGKKPTDKDVVTIHYRGRMLDGTEVVNTHAAEDPMKLKVVDTISGLREALQLMSPGSKWELYVPYLLAYGQRGSGPIPPAATLIFELELLGVE